MPTMLPPPADTEGSNSPQSTPTPRGSRSGWGTANKDPGPAVLCPAPLRGPGTHPGRGPRPGAPAGAFLPWGCRVNLAARFRCSCVRTGLPRGRVRSGGLPPLEDSSPGGRTSGVACVLSVSHARARAPGGQSTYPRYPGRCPTHRRRSALSDHWPNGWTSGTRIYTWCRRASPVRDGLFVCPLCGQTTHSAQPRPLSRPLQPQPQPMTSTDAVITKVKATESSQFALGLQGSCDLRGESRPRHGAAGGFLHGGAGGHRDFVPRRVFLLVTS